MSHNILDFMSEFLFENYVRMNQKDLPRCKGSQFKNHGISGAILTLGSRILILNSRCVEGAKYVRVLQLAPITNNL